MTTIIILLVALTTSICLNLFLFYRLRKKKSRPQSLELQEFLADLLSGIGMVAVGRVDPASILLRSPRAGN